MTRNHRLTLVTLLSLSLGACAASSMGTGASMSSSQAPALTAPIINASGATIGEARLSDAAGGVRLAVRVRDLPPGGHGFHIHMVGRCDTPDFTTAGGHWNPGQHQHGHQNPQGAHAGDLPNLTVAADGTAVFDQVLPGIALRSGAAPMLDADGAAIVIHAAPDDEKTDPTGNSGARIACAAFS